MDLTDAPPIVRAFAECRVAHPALDDALADVLRKSRAGATRNFVLLYGPSGVGKSALLERLVRDINARERTRMLADPPLVPVIGLSASGPTGPFDLFSFFLDACRKLGEPAVDDRKMRAQPALHGSRRIRTDEDAKHLFLDAIAARRTRVAVIDESYHLRHGIRTEVALLERMDLLKSLAQETGLVLVLAGTYQILELRNVSEQLGRRSTEVHFARYAPTDEGQKGFGVAFGRLLKKTGIPVAPDVESYVYDLFERTLGCVGHLKDWLTEALWAAVEEGAPLSRRHLEQRKPHIDTVIKAAEMIAQGERSVAETPEKQVYLRELLGLERPDAKAPADPSSGGAAERAAPAGAVPAVPAGAVRATPAKAPATPRGPKARRPKPGRRRAVRDRVGA